MANAFLVLLCRIIYNHANQIEIYYTKIDHFDVITNLEVVNIVAFKLPSVDMAIENEIKEFPIGPIIFLPNVYFLIKTR